MNVMQLILVTHIVFSLTSVVTDIPVHLVLVDRPRHAKVEVKFVNNTRETLCIAEGEWPTEKGTLNYMGDRVALLVGNQRFPIRDFDTGYCDGRFDPCAYRIKPGATIKAFIPYREFNLPQQLWLRPKKMVYPLYAYVCR